MITKNMLPGIFGMMLIIFALSWGNMVWQPWFFLIGSVGITITALVERHRLFIGLQIIVLTGAIAALSPFAPSIKGLLPLLISIPVLGFLARQGILVTKNAWFGAVGLVALGFGYAVQDPLGFFIGGALVSTFSGIELYAGFKPALIWLILNLTFTVVAAWKLVS